ncbi:hypothetical protein BJ742DRAFT_800975 [Cladochytrium replicatum]|nr:hypothetical protein BJ742DRAFT_800975 [Cladochytrium replicatum]
MHQNHPAYCCNGQQTIVPSLRRPFFDHVAVQTNSNPSTNLGHGSLPWPLAFKAPPSTPRLAHLPTPPILPQPLPRSIINSNDHLDLFNNEWLIHLRQPVPTMDDTVASQLFSSSSNLTSLNEQFPAERLDTPVTPPAVLSQSPSTVTWEPSWSTNTTASHPGIISLRSPTTAVFTQTLNKIDPTMIGNSSPSSRNILSHQQPNKYSFQVPTSSNNNRTSVATTPQRHAAHSRRPPNSFMSYRLARGHEVTLANPHLTSQQVSRVIGQMWRNEDPAVRERFDREAKERHSQFAHTVVPRGSRKTGNRNAKKMVGSEVEVTRSDDGVKVTGCRLYDPTISCSTQFGKKELELARSAAQISVAAFVNAMEEECSQSVFKSIF